MMRSRVYLHWILAIPLSCVASSGPAQDGEHVVLAKISEHENSELVQGGVGARQSESALAFSKNARGGIPRAVTKKAVPGIGVPGSASIRPAALNSETRQVIPKEPSGTPKGSRAGGATSASRRSRSTRSAPWVGVERLEKPFRSRQQSVEEEFLALPPWKLFQSTSRVDGEAPPVDCLSVLPLFYRSQPRRSGFEIAAEHVIRRKLFSEVRRFFKSTWREQFRSTPTLSYGKYMQGITAFNQIGRGPDYDRGNTQYLASELKRNVFQRTNREGEIDFEILSWGPLIVMDSGSVRFDVGRLVSRSSTGAVESIGSEGTSDDEESMSSEEKAAQAEKSEPILSTRNYSIGTSVRLGFNPSQAYEQDPTWLIDKYGVSLEVDWLSGVLGRKRLSTEFEMQFERDGEYAALVNFVFNSR